MEQVEQIIELKRKYNLLEKDFTLKKAKEWYTLNNPFIETLYEKDELVGFCEWITAKEIPKSFEDYPTEPEEGNVLIIGTLIARRPYVMWRLKDMILKKNKDRIATVWHKKRDNELIVIRRRHDTVMA